MACGTKSEPVKALAAVCCAVLVLAGCGTVGERAVRDPLSANVGVYDPPPPGAQRVRVGVPPFAVEPPRGPFDFHPGRLEGKAADQITTLLHQSGRFNVIERAQLEQLLREQDLEGIVRAGEMARPAQVRGVDYLMLGKITGFRVTAQQTDQQIGVGRGWVADQLGGITGGMDRKETIITAEMGVDLRLVDPTTGEVRSAHFSQFRQQDTASGFGITVAGVGGRGDAEVKISEDDAGRLMRLAFDDTLRKMMPEIDQRVLIAAPAAEQAPPAPAQGGGFCGQCGNRLATGAKFCGGCGSQVQ